MRNPKPLFEKNETTNKHLPAAAKPKPKTTTTNPQRNHPKLLLPNHKLTPYYDMKEKPDSKNVSNQLGLNHSVHKAQLHEAVKNKKPIKQNKKHK